MATHSSILAWEIPRMEEPGRLWSMVLKRVRYDLQIKQRNYMLSSFSHVRLCDPMDCSPPDSFVHGISQARNTGVGYWFLPQGTFPTQGSNPHLFRLLYWQAGSLPPSPPGDLLKFM